MKNWNFGEFTAPKNEEEALRLSEELNDSSYEIITGLPIILQEKEVDFHLICFKVNGVDYYPNQLVSEFKAALSR